MGIINIICLLFNYYNSLQYISKSVNYSDAFSHFFTYARMCKLLSL